MSSREPVLRALLVNLRTGLRIGLLRPFDPSRLQVDIRQVVLLLLVAFGLDVLSDFIHVKPERQFNGWGVISQLANYAMFLLAAYLATQIQGQLERFGLLVVAMLAAEPVGQGMIEIYLLSLDFAAAGENDWMAWGVYALLVAWFFAVFFRAQRRLFTTSHRRTALAVGIYFGVILANSFVLPHTEVWYTAYAEDDAPSRPALDVEATYYAQPELLNAALERLQPQRPGIHDIYFVGVAGWAEQDVFLHEVRSVHQLFDARFDTAGRSLVLINNPATVGEVPLANASNLQRVLHHIGELMDPDEDMLFLYVTSHGSSKHEVSMHYWPLSLNDISAGRLSEMLAASAIGWRAVVISACYSGGFIPSLNDAKTMVLTASAADRQSFGCSNENVWTYFGEAYFDKALPQTPSFVAAFQRAASVIAEREASEKLEPSLPQAWVGEDIAQFLPKLETRLATLNGNVEAQPVDCGDLAVGQSSCR